MKTSRTTYLRAAAAAAALLFAVPNDSAPACDDGAARNLLLTGWMNAALNPPKQEDIEFFIRQGGVPNIMLLVDTSGSMRRLAPDGPHTLGGGVGSYTTAAPVVGTDVPQGFWIREAMRGDVATQNAALAAPVATRPTGCGLDAVSAAAPNFMDHPMFQTVENRRFATPCGTATDMSYVGAPYGGHTVDYPGLLTVCPYFTASNSQATGAPGFDPDYYSTSTTALTVGGGNPNFFPRDLVFHDSEYVQDTTYYGYNGALPFRHSFGDGWTDLGVYPAKTASNTVASIASFCANYPGNAVLQGTRTRADICQECLEKKGWWYDGIILGNDDMGVNYGYPSLWYTGNYLNFFPPKFLVARKILKDVIAVQSRVRMAVMSFNSSSTGAQKDKDFNPSCGMPDNSSFDSNRGAYVGIIDNLVFNHGTPVSRALFEVGRYYHTPDLPWFGYARDAAKESSSTANQAAVCYSCQTSSVIVITDGQPNSGDGGGTQLPSGGLTSAQISGAVYAGATGTGIQGIKKDVCPECEVFGCADGNCATTDYRDNLIKTAFYMHNMDLRKNAETTLDCKGNGGKQVLDIYTVGFGTASLQNANTILAAAASAGGGSFVRAEDPGALKQGLFDILEQINTRSTSFSVATVSTLQTTAGRSVIVPRFDPARASQWQGHLARYDLYSEFVNTCVESVAGDGAGDLDCDGRCTSVFLQDADGDFISEDSNGTFRKNDPPNLPTCDAAPVCKAKGAPCSVPGTALATAWWNAGDELAQRAWKDRSVWTATDTNGDGKIDLADDTFELNTNSDGPATRIVPYLGIGTQGSGAGVCETIASRMIALGANAWATTVLSNKLECAKAIIRYVRGADLFNEAGRPGFPPSASMEDAWDRAFKLGDIFHSSPVVVEPPFPSTERAIMCPNGLTNQCIPALWRTPTKHEGDGNAYQEYVDSSEFQNRRKVVLVGANDGLLHAFNGGTWRANQDDPATTALDESQPPFNGYYERGNLSGPDELWAFLPPGLLGKLPLMLTTEHHLYVDGSSMVRDVWVDGTTNGLSGATAKNDVKEKQEFHTVAVTGLRRGGTHFFALDVTSATEANVPPKLLWMFPQPDDRTLLQMGETYDSFLPRPPPIGPVRVKADANGGMPYADTPEMPNALSGATKYHERWVAFLNGGFDPQYVRGRGVYMVDVWTGRTVWDFAYPDNPAAADPSDPRLQLRYPVPATVGMVAWGQNATRKVTETNDYFFDTATFGDAGGQLWTLRFSEPAQLDGAGKASNWFGARMFQMGGQIPCTMCSNQPFFYMTANVALPDSALMRVMAGTGDRFNLLDKNGGVCGPDNLRACVMRGCTVQLDAGANRLSVPDLGTQSWGLGQVACGAMTDTASASTFSTCSAEGEVKVVISNCPSPDPATAPKTTYKDVKVACANQDDGEYACVRTQNDLGSKLTLSDTANTPNVGNWYYSLVGFEENGSRQIFWNLAGAKAYDAARLWVRQAGATRTASAGIVMMAATNTNPAPLATATSPGWAVYFDHGPTVIADEHTFTVNAMDERVSATSAIRGRVATWSTIQQTIGEATSANAGCRTSRCTVVDRRVSYRYNADVVTGAPLLRDPATNAIQRAFVATNLVPPQGDQTTVFINQQGQVAVGLTSVSPERGASNVAMSEPMEPTYGVGTLEVSRQEHACRHAWPGSETTPASPPTQEVCR